MKTGWIIGIVVAAIIMLVAIFLVIALLFIPTRVIRGGQNDSEGKLVGGCGGVYYQNWQECCDNYAEENGIIHVQCVGNWTVENNACRWICASTKSSPYCETSNTTGSEENSGWWYDFQKYPGSSLYIPHLVKQNANCENCTALCQVVNLTEGWYDSCDGSLIINADCA